MRGFTPDDVEGLIDVIEWYRDDWFNNPAMKQICNEFVTDLKDPELTQERFDTVELIVDMWID